MYKYVYKLYSVSISRLYLPYFNLFIAVSPPFSARDSAHNLSLTNSADNEAQNEIQNKITKNSKSKKENKKQLVRRCRRAHTAATATENATLLLLPLLAQNSLQLQQSKRLGTL